jgi:hypothetical protein
VIAFQLTGYAGEHMNDLASVFRVRTTHWLFSDPYDFIVKTSNLFLHFQQVPMNAEPAKGIEQSVLCFLRMQPVLA